RRHLRAPSPVEITSYNRLWLPRLKLSRCCSSTVVAAGPARARRQGVPDAPRRRSLHTGVPRRPAEPARRLLVEPAIDPVLAPGREVRVPDVPAVAGIQGVPARGPVDAPGLIADPTAVGVEVELDIVAHA